MGVNVIQARGREIIIDGGDPLPGCPGSQDEVNRWVDTANEEKEEYYEPQWGFDCGFKLDYDGPLLSVSSRFYPPKTHYGPKWDGTVSIYLLDKKVKVREFECPTLDVLKEEVEVYVESFIMDLKKSFLDLLP